jgi:hypothetical protein
MSFLLNDYGQQMSESRLRWAISVELGRQLPSDRWPDEGVPSVNLDGTTVYVLPKNNTGCRKHRSRAICPVCGQDVPTGRLHQHLKGAACRSKQN